MASSLEWLKENRCGFAKLSGLAMIPSQHLDEHFDFKLLPKNCHPINVKGLWGVICFPSDQKNTITLDKCLVYHSGNCSTISSYFRHDFKTTTPGCLLKLYKCPVIIYDYKGTGCNNNFMEDEMVGSQSVKFRPTYASIVKDGQHFIEYALENFHKVFVWGSSLGAAVAAIALHQIVSHHETLELMSMSQPSELEIVKRLTFHHHDSFTNTARVVFPSLPLKWIFGLLGGNLDAESSVKYLIDMNIPTTILCNRADPVIPKGSRMAEKLEGNPKVNIIYCNTYAHADLQVYLEESQNVQATIALL